MENNKPQSYELLLVYPDNSNAKFTIQPDILSIAHLIKLAKEPFSSKSASIKLFFLVKNLE
jgi:hypothetical protein